MANDVGKAYIDVPEDLKQVKRWCLYKIMERDGKKTKVPLQPNGKFAKSTDISTWNTYDTCLKALSKNIGEGLGFMLGDGYLGIDIDKVTEDMNEYFKDNNADSMTADFLRNISTYAEFSPSKTGLHFIGKGKIPGERKRYNNLEIYDKDRFFTVTGNAIKDKDRTGIKNIESELKPLYDKYMPKPKMANIENRKLPNLIFYGGDRNVLEKLFDRGYFSYSGEDLRQIYNGNYGSYFKSRSEADFFMLQRLIYYTGNISEAVSLMESSGLRRDKWYKRRGGTNYLNYVAEKAFNGMSTFYDWDRENRYKRSNEDRNKTTTSYENSDKEKNGDIMRRYDTGDLKYILDYLKKEIKSDVSKYEEYLKASGNNYKYSYTHQLSIYNVNKDATACAEYDYWKSIGRVVRKNEKGIPLLDEKTGKIKYIFDVSQTVSRNHNISEVKLWEFDSKKHIEVLDKLINQFKQKDAGLIFSLDEKIDFLAGLYARQYLYKITDELSDDFLQEHSKLDTLVFLKESVKVSMCARMGVEYTADKNNFKVLSNKLKLNDLDKLLIYISGISRQVLNNIGKEISDFYRQEQIEKNSKKEQTEKDKERYNIYTKENKLENETGGKENGRKSDVGRQGIYSRGRDILSDNQGELFRGNGGRIYDREDVRGRAGAYSEDKNAEDGRRESLKEIFQGKTEIFKRKQEGLLRTDVAGGNFRGTPSEKRGGSDGLYYEGKTEDDGALGIDRGTTKQRLSEIRRSDEEPRYGIRQDGNAADNLGIENTDINNEKVLQTAEKEVKQTSFSFAQNTGQLGFLIPLRQNQIDTVLIYGGNEHNLRLDVIAEFTKGKTNEELADFLKDTFKGGNGFYLGEQKICAWYGNDGIYLSNDISSRENYTQILFWKDAASRIGQLLEEGRYASNVELIEAIGNERAELAEKLWYLKGDLRDDVKEDFLPILNEKQIASYPEKTDYLAKMLQDKDFRANLKAEYTEFIEEYKENPDVLRFHYHKLNDISNRLDDLELLRKEFTTNLTELSKVQGFITEDEIDENLRGGSGVSGGKKRIYEFFTKNHNLKEQAEFLKNEYGAGGSSHALSGARGSSEDYDAKGIKLTKDGCKEVFFNWNQVAKRIEDLVRNDKYLTKEEQALLQAEKEDVKSIDISQNIENFDIVENNSESTYVEKEESKVKITSDKEDKTTKFYSKENPYDLVTDEMLERVPSLYDQEDLSLSNKEVHAAYIIPFKSNWTWYMTEYDKETGEAFGLVLGDEAEWGYFNINELKELNAQRLIIEDFPTTFRELKDTELKKQMSEEELQGVFNGELTFDDKREEEILILQDEEGISRSEAEKLYDRMQNAFQDNVDSENPSADIENAENLIYEEYMEEKPANPNDYWVVEFNEGMELIESSYKGRIVTKELIDEIKALDEKIKIHNKTAGEDEYGNATDKWAGYSKFYFDHIEDGEVTEHLRMDIGDGNESNQRDFEYLYEQVKLDKENSIEDRQNIYNTIKNILEKESITVFSDKADYKKLFSYLYDFSYSDGSKLSEYSPFEDDENISDLVRLTLFKNSDGEFRAVYNNADSLTYSSNVDKFIEKIESEMKAREIEKKEDISNVDNKIAVKVGYYYAVVDKEKVSDIALHKTGIKIYPRKDNLQGKVYPLYNGRTFGESQKVDKLFDEIAVGMKDTPLTDLNDLLYIENKGLFEIEEDTVTEEKLGYDFYISSFGEQFPNYYEDIYISNNNLMIDDARQSIAYINKENELEFRVNLPDEEKNKVLEIRDKKKVLSNLIKKDIEERKKLLL